MTNSLNQTKTKLPHNELKDKIVLNVKNDLIKIEKALHQNLKPYLDLVSEIASHLLFSGGKRLRPLLTLLSARVCLSSSNSESHILKEKYLDKDSLLKSDKENLLKSNRDNLLKKHLTSSNSSLIDNLENSIIKFSTIFEYLHAATLLHDDVVDEAAMRRGRPSAHSRWSVPKVVLTGDFLLARALTLAAQTNLPSIISIMSKITEDMSQGEIEQMENKGRLELTEEEYLKIIERKTAVLMQGSCRSGAVLAHAEIYNKKYVYDTIIEQEEALDKYGYNLGMAFQMADDLLDYNGDLKTLGKNPGADIREGKLTLPLIYTLSKADKNDKIIIGNIMKNINRDKEDYGKAQDDSFNVIFNIISKYKGIEYTELKAKQYAAQAKKSIGLFESCQAKEILMMLADYSISRKV